MEENQNKNDFLQEQEEKKRKALQELQELQSLLGANRTAGAAASAAPKQETPVKKEPAAAPASAEKPKKAASEKDPIDVWELPKRKKPAEKKPAEKKPAANVMSDDQPTGRITAEKPVDDDDQDTVLLGNSFYRKVQQEKEKMEEAARRERIRRTSPKKKTAAKQQSAQGPAKPRPVRKISRAEMERRRKARRRRRIIRMGSVCIALLIVILLVVFAITRSLKAARNAGSNNDAAAAGSAAEQVIDTSTPASEQESDQYLAIKDDDSLPDYAKEYPGMYADTQSTAVEESDEKVCYLTFDDGPSDTVTPSILETLEKYDVNATFFLVASQIPGNEELVQRMVDDGDTVCIHCYVHEYDTIYASVEAYLEDFAQAYDEIYAATGYKVQGFRFPGGSNNGYITEDTAIYDAITAEMTRRGFEYYDWNAYDGDAEGQTVPEATELASRAVEEVEESSRNDAILLMHDTYGKENTASALPSIIEGLQEAGIPMKPLTASSRPVHFEVDENTPSEYGASADTSSEDTSSADTSSDEADSADTSDTSEDTSSTDGNADYEEVSDSTESEG